MTFYHRVSILRKIIACIIFLFIPNSFHSLCRRRQKQFAAIRGGLLAWDFRVNDEQGAPLAAINRNFTNLPRELFTDSGQYVVHFERTDDAKRHLTLDERAVVLATAFMIDVDYFSRHHGAGYVRAVMCGCDRLLLLLLCASLLSVGCASVYLYVASLLTASAGSCRRSVWRRTTRPPQPPSPQKRGVPLAQHQVPGPFRSI